MWKYIRFGYLHWIWVLVFITSLFAGGIWLWAGLVYLFVVGVGGELATRDLEDYLTPQQRVPSLHNLVLYGSAFGVALSLFCMTWCASEHDLLGIGQLVNSTLLIIGMDYDVVAGRALNQWHDYLGAALSLGGLFAVTGVSVAHELTHRTSERIDLAIGRWTFALSFSTNFAIEHVWGHHVNVGLSELDPVTPKRGIGFYEFLIRGSWRQWALGLEIERERLGPLGISKLLFHHRIFRAYLRGLFVGALILFAGGITAALVWSVSLLFAKYILEGLNFFSHYGIVRIKGEDIGIRHTFSTANMHSNNMTFNLGRHGAHHIRDAAYYDLEHMSMPVTPYGYLTMTVISWIPPLFRKVMFPLLREWDETWATENEREIAMVHSRDSGLSALKASIDKER